MDTVNRKEDATGKETLEDLEEEGLVDTDDTDEDGLSPDGAFDDEDELKDAGPV